jgi:hypothetical protein
MKAGGVSRLDKKVFFQWMGKFAAFLIRKGQGKSAARSVLNKKSGENPLRWFAAMAKSHCAFFKNDKRQKTHTKQSFSYR